MPEVTITVPEHIYRAIQDYAIYTGETPDEFCSRQITEIVEKTNRQMLGQIAEVTEGDSKQHDDNHPRHLLPTVSGAVGDRSRRPGHVP